MKSCANTHILQIKNFSMISFWAKLRKLLYFHVANVMQGVFSWKRVFSWKTNFGPPESGSSANPSSREHFMSYQWNKSSRSEGCVHEIRDFCRAEFEGKSLPIYRETCTTWRIQCASSTKYESLSISLLEFISQLNENLKFIEVT